MTAGGRLAERWDAGRCDSSVRELFALAEDLDRAYGQLARTEAGLADWRGAAAERARPRLLRAAAQVSGLASRLRQAADAVRSGLAGVAEAARLAAVPAQSPREAAEATAVAEAVDRRIAAGLMELAVPVETSPVAGRTAADVARWWTALPPHLRRRALERWTAELAGLAGLPAGVRDAANRILLADLLRRLRTERELLAGRTGLRIPRQWARMVEVRSMLAVAEDVERTLADLAGERPPPQLLALDLTGAGRVAIGLGDVDRARHLAVLVPGMGTDAVHGVADTVRRAHRLAEQAGRESVESTAVVAWIGYAAPGWREVPFAARARTGGRLLAADVAALAAGRTADGGDRAHVTLVGHSYGSTVIGAAVRVRPRLADDLVLLGSPGVLAEDVTELGQPAGRVYVGEAPLDPVGDLGAFGADPGDRRFGAVRMRADTGPLSWPARLAGGSHSGYFDPGSEAMRNAARVVAGRGPDVTREDP